MAKHAQGEWQIHRLADDKGLEIVADGGHRKIAVMTWYGYDEKCKQEDDANALLLKAAPTMLEALKAFADHEPISYDDFAVGASYACECCNAVGRDHDVKHQDSCAWLMAKAAIRLAEGGE